MSVQAKESNSTTAEGDSAAQSVFARTGIPSLNLPKGGGAIHGIGEKFAANPVTGTGSMSIPIGVSPGRGGFGPQLTLLYDSGSGNGAFGAGWNLSLPQITRKTDKGIPNYQNDTDVFVLSGAEDLVPLLTEMGEVVEREENRHRVRQYRPRVEGLFSRIERWTRLNDGEAHWRSITKDNVTTLYGKSAESRVSHPEAAAQTFTWLICESYDDKGNAILFTYKPEDVGSVDSSQPQERNRNPEGYAQKFIKRIRYGNRSPSQPNEDLTQRSDWMFEVVFDYGEHDLEVPSVIEAVIWPVRLDPFSHCRAGFEVRTQRLCRRVLMFHHFPEEGPAGFEEPVIGSNCLASATEFQHDETAIASYLISVTHSSFRRKGAGYISRSNPPVQFEYSRAVIESELKIVDSDSLENLPYGIDGGHYQYVDLFGEGVPGTLTNQAEAWFYKRNLSPLELTTQRAASGPDRALATARFAPVELVPAMPASAQAGGSQQLIDLDGDGALDLVQFAPPVAGYMPQDSEGEWQRFVPFPALPNLDWSSGNLRHLDLVGDGHSDLLIADGKQFEWYRSLAKEGFDPAEFVALPFDDEAGPGLVFQRGQDTIYLADMNGDGLTDLVRIRNGEVSYWPSLGYGRFGAKVTMGNSPLFDHTDMFDHARIRLADIDGSGVVDIIYIGRDAISVYLNESGNSWAKPVVITAFPNVDNLASVQVMDLLGNGTACLVWSSPLTSDARQPMRYLDLMGGQKPHLLVRSVNNLGAETRMQYAPSTKFYLQDKYAGTPWITKLPFPVHVVERVETFDRISRNWFVSRYRYHHGYFDGVEREFRGFGMVEQFDTEAFETLEANSTAHLGDLAATNIDPISHVPPVHTKTWFHTGVHRDRERISRLFEKEYFRDPGLDLDAARGRLLPDTVLPPNLTGDEEREACRALKGAMLRQEVYAADGEPEAAIPYAVTEQNFAVTKLQSRGPLNRFGVYFVHPLEVISYHYERNASDPRIGHTVTLEVDAFGNVLKAAAIGYGRQPGLSNLKGEDKARQEQLHLTYSEAEFTNAINDSDILRTPALAEARTYELTGLAPANGLRFTLSELANLSALPEFPYEQPAEPSVKAKRLIERARTRYRSDDLTEILPLGRQQTLALPGESFHQAFTPGLLDAYAPKLTRADAANLLKGEGRYVDLDGDGNLWIPSGRAFFTPQPASAAAELAEAKAHFFLPHRYEDAFGFASFVEFDSHDLLITRTTDALGNTVTAENNYRLLQPFRITDPNGNFSSVAFDTLGMAVASAVSGKAGEGDELSGFKTDLDQADLDAFFASPRPADRNLLGNASSRVIYDTHRWMRDGKPSYAASIVREIHAHDPGGATTPIQTALSYSDGFGREIQKKIQAEAESGSTALRWVGSGWTIFNNKGKPTKQFEPFFSATHDFEFGRALGVSPTIFYDPAGRVVATLHPNHTYEKVLFDPWQQTSWDVNDTVLLDPGIDRDVRGYFSRLPDSDYRPSWHSQMAASASAPDRQAASQTKDHAATPGIAHLDALGRPFRSIADNGAGEKFETRVELDLEGNHRSVTDANARVIMRYDYDMLGHQIHQAGMEAGERWAVTDVMGKPIRGFDSRGFVRQITYDELHRPTGLLVDGSLAERTVYGEGQGAVLNHRGRVHQLFDAAGVVTSLAYDFKGNALHSQRELLKDYKTPVDWLSVVPPEIESAFTSHATFDAMGRPVTSTSPDGSIYRPSFNEANLLERVEVNLRGSAQATPFVTNIDYDAKGQRKRIAYGNGAVTTYAYDPLTFRLTNLRTTRSATSNGVVSNLFQSADVVQDLHYTFDPVGNITRIEDAAMSTVFNGQQVDPVSEYLYDPTYRLTQAKGREHGGQVQFDFVKLGRDYPFGGLQPGANDLQAMRNYTEHYSYDAAGNFDFIKHQISSGGWTRDYVYEEPSLLDPAQRSNRLTRTKVGDFTEAYTYADASGHDVHGCMTALGATAITWDFKDQLQQVDLGGGGMAFYVYDASGQRVRKVIESREGKPQHERAYLGGFELYREFGASGAVTLTRETLHVMDDAQRIAMVETDVATAKPVIRYQLGNHLGSASVELDAVGGLISYEEYHPYGTSAVQVSTGEHSRKRYRYTGMERDEESGFACHSARYYLPWLGRWASCDPISIAGGFNEYEYAKDMPNIFKDNSGKSPVDESFDKFTSKILEREKAAYFASHKYSKSHEANTKIEIDKTIMGGSFIDDGTVDLHNEEYLKKLISISSAGSAGVKVNLKKNEMQFFIIHGGAEGFLSNKLLTNYGTDADLENIDANKVDYGLTKSTDGKVSGARFDVNDLIIAFDSKGKLVSAAPLQRTVFSGKMSEETQNFDTNTQDHNGVYIYRNTHPGWIPYIGLYVNNPIRTKKQNTHHNPKTKTLSHTDYHVSERTNGCHFICDIDTPKLEDQKINNFTPSFLVNVIQNRGFKVDEIKGESIYLGKMRVIFIR